LILAGDLDEAARFLARLERWEPHAGRTQRLQEALAKARTETT
jgi:hypothetical protein